MAPDPADLAAFAGWVLALLPRLLLYPGGLFAAAGAWLLTAALRRLAPARAAPAPPAAGPEGAALLSLALAWSAWALLPLPGATPLPGAPDLLVMIALLASAALLGALADGSADAWRPEVQGRPVLVAAPLLALAALHPGSLLPAPAPTIVPFGPELARLLAGLAFVAGFCLCYGAPGAAPWQRGGPWTVRAAVWLGWWGWLGVGAALGPAGWATADGPAWVGPVLVGVLGAAAAAALATPVAQALAARAAPWAWGALGLALLALLL